MARRTEASSGPARALTTPPPPRRPPPPRHPRTGGCRRGRCRGTARARRRAARAGRRGGGAGGRRPRWATTSSTTSVPARPPRVTRRRSGGTSGASGAVEEARHRGIGVGQGPRAQPDEQDDQGAPRPARRGSTGLLRGRSSTTRAGPLGQRGDDVAGRGLGHPWRCAAPGGEHGAALLAGQHRQQRLGRHPAAHVAQVVPPPAGQVLDAGGHLEAPAQQVEVDDDGRRPGGREPAPDGERERARAEAAGGPDDGGHALVVRSSGQARRPGAARGAPWTHRGPCGRRPRGATGLWTTRPAPRANRASAATRPGTPDDTGHGTAPVGGTTGAVGEPSSGGEKPVRRSLNPEGERVSPSCLMTESQRKPRSRPVEIVLRIPRSRRNPKVAPTMFNL